MAETQSPLQNPYVGPRAFQTGEALYGRDQPLRELLNLLIAERVVLLYSPSGAGKSSLINAGLIPRLRDDGFTVLPVMRVNEPLASDGAANGANRYLTSALRSLEEALPAEQRLPPDQLAALSLAGYLDHWAAALPPHAAPEDAPPGAADSLVLIFDQFEEIVTVDPTDRPAKAEFFAQVGAALRDRTRWALFAMREDFVASLDPFTRPIPTRLGTTFRLDLLDPAAARQAIQQPARDAGVDFTGGAVDKLIDDLRQVQVQQPDGSLARQAGPYVEPVQLQVVCYRLWQHLPAQADKIVEQDVESVGDVDAALAGYYEDRIAAVAQATGVRERVIRNWFHRQLITEQGIRSQVLRGQTDSEGLDNEAVRLLENAHLVRAEKRGGATWFELAHDRLIGPVRESNAAWYQAHLVAMQRQAELWDSQGRQPGMLLTDQALVEAEQWAAAHAGELTGVETEFMENCRALRKAREREQRQNRRIRWLATAASITSIVSILALAFGVYQMLATVSQKLAAQSITLKETEPDIAMLLAEQASQVPFAASRDVRDALLHSVQGSSEQLIAFLRGHRDRVWGVAFNHQAGRPILATGGDDGTLRLWDVNARAVITSMVNPNNQASIYSVAFSPDDRLLAAGSGDGSIILWDMAGQATQVISPVLKQHAGGVLGIAFSHDGRRLVSGGMDGRVIVWDIATRSVITQLPAMHTNWVWAVAFSPDDHVVASGGRDLTVKLWDVDPAPGAITVTQTLTDQGRNITSLAFGDAGGKTILASGDASGGMVVWDVTTWRNDKVKPGRTTRLGILQGIVFGLDFTRAGDETRLVATTDNQTTGWMRIWRVDLTQGITRTRLIPLTAWLHGHSRGMLRVAFNPGGDLIATGGKEGLVGLWHANSGSALIGHQAAVLAVSTDPEGKRLLTSGADGRVIHWDVDARRMANVVTLTAVNTTPLAVASFSPAGDVLATNGATNTVLLWDTRTGENMAVLEGQPGRVKSLAFSPDGATLASGDDQSSILLWRVADRARIGRMSAPQGDITSLAFSGDGALLASAGCGTIIKTPRSNDCGRGEVRLWKVSTQELVGRPLAGRSGLVSSVAFNHSGDTLAAGSNDGPITLWDVRNQLQGISFYNNGADTVTALAFTPDDQHLAAANASDNNITLWDVRTGQPAGDQFVEQSVRVNALAFNRDGTRMFSGGGDTIAEVWDLDLAHWHARICQVANRNMTADEWSRYVAFGPYQKTCRNLP